MMRVAHIIRATGIAGAETHLLSLLAGLRAQRIEAHLVLLTRGAMPMAEYRARLAARHIPVHPLAMRGHFDPTLLRRLVSLLKRLRPQIVHTHLQHADLHAALAAKWAGTPALVSSRHNDNAFRRRQPWRMLNRGLWSFFDAGIAISDAVAEFATQVESAPPERLRVIRYGLDSPSFGAAGRQRLRSEARAELGVADGRPLLGMACRLTEQKGVSHALRAFAFTRAEFPRAQLLIAGDGPLRAALEAEAQELGLGAAARFLGWREDVPRLLTGFDMLVQPSLWEGFGLILLEAMAGGLPVIATRVSAIPEIVVHEDTGLLVPPARPAALAQAMLRLLRDRPLAACMGMRGAERAGTHFSAERMVADTLALYRELL